MTQCVTVTLFFFIILTSVCYTVCKQGSTTRPFVPHHQTRVGNMCDSLAVFQLSSSKNPISRLVSVTPIFRVVERYAPPTHGGNAKCPFAKYLALGIWHQEIFTSSTKYLVPSAPRPADTTRNHPILPEETSSSQQCRQCHHCKHH